MMIGFFQWIAFVFALHPLHVSVTEIEYNEKEKRLEVMMRVFIDDLELALRSRFNKPEMDILAPTSPTLDEMMNEYLKDHFKITLDNKVQKTSYLGHERDGEAFVFYVEVPNIKKWKEIVVTNDIIMEMYDDQSNLVHVTVRGKVKSLRLTPSARADKLTFDIK
jgi:hypothetical protein